MKKEQIGYFSSIALFLLGMILRLNARAMAWPTRYSYSGSRADTQWARQEDAIAQVALVLMCIGGLALLITYVFWLLARDSANTTNEL